MRVHQDRTHITTYLRKTRQTSPVLFKSKARLKKVRNPLIIFLIGGIISDMTQISQEIE